MPLKHDQEDYFNPLDYTLKTFPFAYSRKKLAKSRHFFFVIEKKLLKLVNSPKGLNKRKFQSSKKAFQPLTEISAGKSTKNFKGLEKNFRLEKDGKFQQV